MGADARAGVREQLAQLRAEEGAMADFRERLGATVAAMRCEPPPPPPPPPLPRPSLGGTVLGST